MTIKISIKNVPFVDLSSDDGPLNRHSNLHALSCLFDRFTIFLYLMDNAYPITLGVYYSHLLPKLSYKNFSSKHRWAVPSKNEALHKLEFTNWCYFIK